MEQFDTDVVIIGGGTAGMAAAVAAAEGGARVIVLEKTGRTGGTGNMAMGLFAVESKLQRMKHMALTREEAFDIYMKFTHWRVNARLVRAFIDKSGDTIDWLQNMGVEFEGLFAHGVGNYPVQHTIKPNPDGSKKDGAAGTMMNILAEKAAELGVKVIPKTSVQEILKQGDSIAGAVAKDKSGDEIRVKASAAIIATGGSSGGILSEDKETSWGGIRMAREVGAATVETHAKTRSVPLSYIDFFSGLGISFYQPTLTVNLSGERFMNEELVMGCIYEANAVYRQPESIAYTIFDEDTKNHFVEKGFDYFPNGENPDLTRATDFDSELKSLMDKGSDAIYVADSLEELAEKTGINPQGLLETVKEYNSSCESGHDEIFNKNSRYLRPVKTPRFFAGKRAGGAVLGWNGIRINYKIEVIAPDHTVIPGLYATGMDAVCEMYHDTYPFMLPATALGFAVNSGRMAGENAAVYVKSISNP